MNRILVTKTVEGYDHEVEEQTNKFLLKLKARNPQLKALGVDHGPGQRMVQTIVIETDEELPS